MKQLIKDVLHDMSAGQIDISSTGACELIATTITAALKTKGSYKEYTDYELDEQRARASWVCSICGESTFEVDYDYIGTGANHLGCELKSQEEIDEYIDDIDEQAYAQGRKSSMNEMEIRRQKNWLQKKHEDKVFDEVSSVDYYTGPDGHYEKQPDDEVYHVVKHLGYDTKDKKQTVVGKISKSQLNNIYPLHKKNNNSLA